MSQLLGERRRPSDVLDKLSLNAAQKLALARPPIAAAVKVLKMNKATQRDK